MTLRDLAERSSLPLQDLEQALQGVEPTQTALTKIARELSLPVFAFYMRKPPNLYDSIPDFRSKLPMPAILSRETVETVQLAVAIRKLADQFNVEPARNLPKFEAASNGDIGRFALSMRAFFGITLDDQIKCNDAKAFYVLCRKKIEDKRIFVLQDSFPSGDGSGLCLADSRYPVIVVNTKRQSRGRRLFTLIHELGHVLLGATGLSDPFKRNNDIERRCNRFAAAFLVPKSFARGLLGYSQISRDPSLQEVKWAANKLKVSQQAAVLRLEQLGIYSAGAHKRWLAEVKGGNPDFGDAGGGAGTPPEQDKVKLARFGFRFANAFGPSIGNGDLSELSLYRASGLKPKYQRSYFSYVRSLNEAALRSLELGDD